MLLNRKISVKAGRERLAQQIVKSIHEREQACVKE